MSFPDVGNCLLVEWLSPGLLLMLGDHAGVPILVGYVLGLMCVGLGMYHIIAMVLHIHGYLLPCVETKHYGFHLETRLIGSSGIQTHDLSIVGRTRCHLSYRASVVRYFIIGLSDEKEKCIPLQARQVGRYQI